MSKEKPIIMDLEPGTYYRCTCGKTKTSPFCDGAHKGTGFEPLAFVITEKKQVALCTCKRTKTSPFCDGAHVKD
jgi:CDGSH-type Zn-finger protein